MSPDSLAAARASAPSAPGEDHAPHRADSVAPSADTQLPLLARPRVLDTVIVLAYLLAAFGLYRDLWLHLGDGYLVDSGEDQTLFEWFFAMQAHAVAAGQPSLFSTLQNYPAGINLMANTSMPGLAVPLAPLTLLAGPTATLALVLSGGLAGTAIGWYWVFSRYLTRSRWAAAIGGGCVGFAPPMVSHAHAHPNFTSAFLLPLIVACLIRLARGGPGTRGALRNGVLLGALVAWQVLIGEEPLLILATGIAVWGLAWAAVRPRTLLAAARPLLTGLGVAVGVSVLLVGYPLWFQFTGPGSYHSLAHALDGNDLAAFGTLPRQSIGGQLLDPGQPVGNPTEQNAFFGWPLLTLLLVAAIWLWREVPARLAAITTVGLAALSVGSPVYLRGADTGIPGPWWVLDRLPLFDSLIESRLTLASLPAIGVLLALASDRALTRQPRQLVPPVRPSWLGWLGSLGWPGRPRWLGWLTSRRLWFAALALAVAPILPVRFATEPRAATPVFFSSGDWRDYVRPGRSLLTVPPPDAGGADALHWQVVAGFGFPLVEGYFVGPAGANRTGIYGADRPPTSLLLASAAVSGTVPPIGPTERARALDDLRHWRADAVVLPNPADQPAPHAALVALLGPGERRDDVLVWDLRGRAR
ncbi:MAG TPA: glycosyl transferase [Pseudonocardia sp.]|uniref:glycosyl transferase n=1 Tax=Pseudonocardia sp. TaxID=60912 RepID=UPI002C9EBDAF|nr:glycosyl transferase [Pseudonocardia sp.]HTF54347.1 glycosyl transferase [Pseudonocardia sp.]